MQSNKEKDYQEWFGKAEEDELSTKAVLKSGAPSTGCFLSEQMAEKYLKGLLIFYENDFPKIHDLLDLETLLLSVVPEIRELHSDLQTLNRYYVETRYPGDYPEFTSDECRKALEAGLRVKTFVLKKIESQKK